MKQNIKEYIKNRTTEFESFFDDNWGLGQFKIDYIKIMIEAGQEFGLKFHFVKTVTAMDDIEWERQTITAHGDHLFVYHQHQSTDLTDFWKKVKQIEEEQKIGKSGVIVQIGTENEKTGRILNQVIEYPDQYSANKQINGKIIYTKKEK